LAAICIVFVLGEVLVTAVILAGGRHPKARSVMTRLGALAVPVLLCCIGVLVMLEAGTFSLV
jgi:cadmium resistance protein CadD (predicted permease)